MPHRARFLRDACPLPALLVLTLLAAGPALAGSGDATLLVSRVVVTPDAAEMVEIHNPTDRYVDLSDVYLTDATFSNGGVFYYKLPTGTDAGGGGFADFHARFPAGASIAPGETQSIAVQGSADFLATYGVDPTYELYEDDASPDDVPDMREAFSGSIDTASPSGLSNGGEVVILFTWDGASDLVEDLDYVVWGDKAEAVDKTGESVDGPDPDATASTFLADTAVAGQDVVDTGGHAVGNGWERVDFTEGTETQSGGNGATGHDETSENLGTTFAETARAADGMPTGAARLLLSEIVVTPTAGEFVEIYNPNDFPVDLSDVYLTDATFEPNGTFYYNIVTGTNAGGGGFSDFHARFPDGASIGAGEYQTVAINGSDGFFSTYGADPTYELFEDAMTADAIPDLREALPGSIDTVSPSGLSNSGEVVILYHWNGASDLVGDLDYAVWGDKNEAVDKTGVAIDGPDADSDTSTYLADTAVAGQDVLAGGAHPFGESFTRDDGDEGTETQSGGNGVDGDDETSEDLSVTWGFDTPTPNTGFLGQIVLTIDDVQVTEGDAGSVLASFTVSLSAAAPPGGVGFDITTQDGTATTADGDYQASTLLGETIAEGVDTYGFDVTVFGDTTGEAVETFTVEVTGVTGTSVVVGDGTGVGTIVNDDPVEIFQVQGAGDASSFAGFSVELEDNVVTAVGPDGFTIQTPTARDDADPDTSNGVWVFLDAVPTVSVGDLVDVTGDVEEFFGLTRIIDPVVGVVGTDTLPPAIPFDAATPSPDPTMPSCAIEMECYEGMRVSVSQGLVTGPTLTFGTDPIAEVQVVASLERPFREPGVLFPGAGGSIPVFDGNPQVFELDTDRLGLAPELISSGGTTFTAEGVVGFEFGDYEIWPTAYTLTPPVQPLPAVPVRAAAADEMTVASLNMLRLYDDVDDPTVSDTVLTTAEYDCRRAKLAAYIDQVLLLPDILAVQEAENLGVLQDLAADLLATTGATYTAELVEGNDVGGIDVGFLVRDTVTVDDVTQLGAGEILPGGTSPLHDRPPLLLEATYSAGGAGFPLAVMAQHTRSFNGIDDPDTADFVRTKRLEQAKSIADKVQDFQTTNPAVPLVVIGDLNAFEFTDGYVDVVGQIAGTVDPAQNLLSAPTVTDPPLVNEVASVPQPERYSFIFDGSAQVLDHALTSLSAWPFVRGMDFGRGNADSPRPLLEDGCDMGDPPGILPLRSSDHDGLVLYLLFEADTVIFGDGFESGDTRAWSAVGGD